MDKRRLYQALGITMLSFGLLGMAPERAHAVDNDASGTATATTEASDADEINLLDLQWEDGATVGYGKVEIVPATVNIEAKATNFDKALIASAPSTVTYDISQYSNEYDKFLCYAGLNKPVFYNGVKIHVYTSTDGKTWDLRAENENIKYNVMPIDFDISGVKYLRFVTEELEGTQGNAVVYVTPRLIKKTVENPFTSVDTYEQKLKNVSTSDALTNNLQTVLDKSFVEKIGYQELSFLYDTLDAKTLKTVEDIFNDKKLMNEFATSKLLGTGSYLDALKVLIRLYDAHKADLNDSTNGDLYRRMMVADAFVYGSPDGYQSSWGARSNYVTDPVKRYEIFKDLYLTNKLDNNKQFSNLTVELLAWVFDAPMDDNEIYWLNDYARKSANKDEGKDYALGVYQIMDWMDLFNFEDAKFYDLANEKQWNDKYNFEKYGIGYGVDGKAQIWMAIEQGGACGLMAGVGVSLAAVFGIPSHVIHQPIHAPYVMYRSQADGSSRWEVETSVAGYEETDQDLGMNLFLGWEDFSWVTQSSSENYLYLMQAALDDKENYDKVQALLSLSNMYAIGTKEYEAILEQALDTQGINIAVFDALMTSYQQNKNRTDEDYLALAKKMQNSLKYYPTVLADAMDYISTLVKDDASKVQIDILKENGLRIGLTATEEDVHQSDVTNYMAKYLLGLMDNQLASFSFDGKDKNKIILNSKFDGIGLQVKYSLDGGKTWEKTEKHTIELSDEQVKSLNSTNDIQLGFVGAADVSKVDLTKEDPDFDENLLQVNDDENRLVGDTSILNKLEYSIDDGKTWKILDPANDGSSFEGDITVKIRKRNNSTNVLEEAAVEKEYTFKENTVDKNEAYIPFKEMTVKETLGNPEQANLIIDGNPTLSSCWTAARDDSGTKDYVVLELNSSRYISKLDYYSRDDTSTNGRATEAIIYTSIDGVNWTQVAHPTGWSTTQAKNSVSFEPTLAKYIKFEAIAESGGTTNLVVSQINLYEDKTETDKTPKVTIKDLSVNQGDSFKAQDFIESIDGSQDLSNYTIEFVKEPDPYGAPGKKSQLIKVTNKDGYSTIISPTLTLKQKNSINLYRETGDIAANIVLDKETSKLSVDSTIPDSILNESSTENFAEFTLYDSDYKEKQSIQINATQSPNDIKKALNSISYEEGDYLLVTTLAEKSMDAFGSNDSILEKDSAKNEEQFQIKSDQLVHVDNLIPTVTSQDVNIQLGETVEVEDFVKEVDGSSDSKDYEISFVNTPDVITAGERDVSFTVTNKFGRSTTGKAKLTVENKNALTVLGYFGERRIALRVDENGKLQLSQDPSGNPLETGDRDFATITIYDKDLNKQVSVSAKSTDTPQTIIDELQGVELKEGSYIETKMYQANRLQATTDGKDILAADQAKATEMIQYKAGKFVYVANYTPIVKMKEKTIQLGETPEPSDFIDSVETINPESDNKVEFQKAPDTFKVGTQDIPITVTNKLGVSKTVTGKLTISDVPTITMIAYGTEERIKMTLDEAQSKLNVIQDTKGTQLDSGSGDFATVTLYDKDLTVKKAITAQVTDTPDVIVNALNDVSYEDGDYLEFNIHSAKKLRVTDGANKVLDEASANTKEMIQIKDGNFIHVENYTPVVKLTEKTISLGEPVEASDFISSIDTIGSENTNKVEFVSEPNVMQSGNQEVSIRVTNVLGQVTETKTTLHVEALKTIEQSINIGGVIEPSAFFNEEDLTKMGANAKIEFVTEPNMNKGGDQEISIRITNANGKSAEVKALLHVQYGNTISLLDYWGGELMNLVLNKDTHHFSAFILSNGEMSTQKFVGLYDKDFNEKTTISVGQHDLTEKIGNVFDDTQYENGDYLKVSTVWANKLAVYTDNQLSLKPEDATNSEVFEIKDDKLVRVSDLNSEITTKDVSISAGQGVQPSDFIDTVDGSSDFTNMKFEFVKSPDTLVEGTNDIEIKATNKFGTVQNIKAKLTVSAAKNLIALTAYQSEERLFITLNDEDSKIEVAQDSKGTILDGGSGDYATISLFDKKMAQKKSVTSEVTDTPDVLVDGLNGADYVEGDYLELKMYLPKKLRIVTDGQETLAKSEAVQDEWLQVKDNHFVVVDQTVTPVIESDNTITYNSGDKVSEDQFLKDIHYKEQVGVIASADLKAVQTDTAGDYKVQVKAENPFSNESVTKEVTISIEAAALVIDSDDAVTVENGAKLAEADFLKSIHLDAASGETASVDLTQVDTSKAGEYKAIVTLTDANNQKVTKEIKVTVKAAPLVITSDDAITVENGAKLVESDFLKSIHLDAAAGETASVDLTQVDTSKAGDYKAIVTLTDATNQKVTKEIKVTVKAAPLVITSDDAVTVENGAKLVEADFLKSIHLDAASGETASVDLTQVDTSKAGDYKAIVTLTDTNNQKVTKEIKVTVKAAPLVITSDDAVTVENGAKLVESDFLKSIHLDTASGETASVDLTKVDTSKAGDYKAIVTLTDAANQKVTKEIKVTVKVAPLVITSDDAVTVENGSKLVEAEFLKSIHLDAAAGETASVDLTQVDTSKAGEYKAIVTLTDAANQKVTKEIKVTVKAAPLTINSDDAVTVENEAKLVESDFLKSIHLDVASGETASVDLTKVDTSKAGDYKAIVTLTDATNQKVTKEIKVTVKAVPLTIVCDDTATIENGAALDQDGFLKSIHLNLSDGETATADVSRVDTSKNGDYIVTVTLTDANGQNTSKDINVTVTDKPVVGGSAHTVATVTLKMDQQKVAPKDPTDATATGGHPTAITDPIDTTKIEALGLNYVSDFDFGTQTFKFGEDYYAKPDSWTNEDGSTKEIPNYIQVSDKRASLDGWTLTASQLVPFSGTDPNNLDTFIKGAEIHLLNGQIVANDDNGTNAPTAAKNVVIGGATIDADGNIQPGEEVTIMSAAPGDAAGTWIETLGDDQTKDKSVKLSIPKDSSLKADTVYSSEIEWTLSDTPTSPEN